MSADPTDDSKAVDLSGVRPERRETVQRRLAALREYEALSKRTWRDVNRLCEPLDLSPAGFYRIWKVWRQYRDPRMLQGVTQERNGPRNLTDDADYIHGLIAAMPPHKSIEQDVLAVERTAKEQGRHVRSRSALRRLVRELREADKPRPLADSPLDLVALDMVPLEIPVRANRRVMLPLATLVMHPASGSVLFARLSLSLPTPDIIAAGVSQWLRSMTTPEPLVIANHILMPKGYGSDWGDLVRVFERRGISRSGNDAPRPPCGVISAETIGREMLGIEMRPRMSHRPPEERRPLVRMANVNSPLSLSEAQAAIDERVAAACPPQITMFQRDGLLRELEAVFDT